MAEDLVGSWIAGGVGGAGAEDGRERAEAVGRGREGGELAEEGAELVVDGVLGGRGWWVGEEGERDGGPVGACRGINSEGGVGEVGFRSMVEEGWEEGREWPGKVGFGG